MSHINAIRASVFGIPTVRVCGMTRALKSFQSARPACLQQIPGLNLSDLGDTSAPLQLNMTWNDGNAPRCHWHGSAGEIEGNTDELTVDVWSDLLLTLSAHALAAHGLFFVTASAVRVNGITWILAETNDGDAMTAATDLLHRGLEVLACSRTVVGDISRLCMADNEVVFEGSALCSRSSTNAPKVRWCHLRLVPEEPYAEIVSPLAHRAVLASHAISSAVLRPVVIGCWRTVVCEFCDETGEQRLQAAIQSHAALPHWRYFGPVSAVADWLEDQVD